VSAYLLDINVGMKGLVLNPAASLPCQKQARKTAKSLLGFDNCIPAPIELGYGVLNKKGGNSLWLY